MHMKDKQIALLWKSTKVQMVNVTCVSCQMFLDFCWQPISPPFEFLLKNFKPLVAKKTELFAKNKFLLEKKVFKDSRFEFFMAFCFEVFKKWFGFLATSAQDGCFGRRNEKAQQQRQQIKVNRNINFLRLLSICESFKWRVHCGQFDRFKRSLNGNRFFSWNCCHRLAVLD